MSWTLLEMAAEGKGNQPQEPDWEGYDAADQLHKNKSSAPHEQPYHHEPW